LARTRQRANPDGYTLVLATTTQLINQYLSKSLPYNLFTDLVPIALIADAPEVVAIHTKLPRRRSPSSWRPHVPT
jgi:tripartite-type tricarboxylate transporter receptor subunit TctC